jgi:hypothetical protein
VVRIPGKVLGVVAALALVVHAYRVVPQFHALLYGHTEFGSLVFLPTLLTLAIGRIVLAWLPPGEVGGHGLRELPATLATSLALGILVHDLLVPVLPHWTSQAVLAALLLLARILTLPGAMVPRHALGGEAWSTLDSLLALGVVGWCGYLLCTTVALEGHVWLALAVLVFAASGCARRARAGRRFGLLALAVIGFPTDLVRSVPGWFSYASHDFVPLCGLALGATALVPWLRRHDRRAGALAGLAFGALFLNRWDPLALAGGVVLLAFSRPRQRAFAAGWFGASAAASTLLGLFAPALASDSGRTGLLVLETTSGFGLLLPGAVLALALGFVTFDWRSGRSPGAIEEPRREGLAVVALATLVFLLVQPEASPWSVAAARTFLAPVLVLAAMLLLAPKARAD